MTVELRRYTRADVERMPGSRAAPAPEALIFRDPTGGPGGSWWRFDPAARSWLRHDGSGFAAGATPPEVLEGAAVIASSTPPTPPATGDGEQRYADARAFMEGSVADARRRFENGELTSEAAEAILSGHVVVGPGPRLWTVGVRTGSWYEFADRAWQRRGGPPAETVTAPEEELLRAGAEIFDQEASLLPEPIVDPWDPPVADAEVGSAPATFPPVEDEPPPPPPDEAPPPDAGPPAESPAESAAFNPTHRVPATGLEAWDRPDPSVAPAVWFEPGTPVRETERSGVWTRIVSAAGAAGWVDGRRLSSLDRSP